jgi:predicted nuclease of predicted toxin-antitoxin system
MSTPPAPRSTQPRRLRFFLDNDVDAGVASMLNRARHYAWTAYQAGLAKASDDDIAVYAHARQAALISHDGVFADERIRNTLGQHVWLDCSQPDAIEVLTKHLDAVVEILAHHPNVVVVVRAASVTVRAGWR